MVELEVQLRSLGMELEAKKAEKALFARTTARRKGRISRKRIGELRGADATVARDKGARDGGSREKSIFRLYVAGDAHHSAHAVSKPGRAVPGTPGRSS